MRLFCLALVGLVPCAFAQAPAPPAKAQPKVVISGVKLRDCGERGSKPALATPQVKLKMGVRFGCKMTMTGTPAGATTRFRAVMYRPDDMKVSAEQSYKLGANDGYVGLTLANDASLVPGEWKLEIYVDEKKMAEEKFVMVK